MLLTLKKLINLEYFLHKDYEAPLPEVHQSDQILLAKNSHGDLQNITILSFLDKWLLFKESEARSLKEMLPGQLWYNFRSGLSAVLIIGSILAGFISVHTVLSYDGKTPVNIASFISVFILSQIFLLLLILTLFLFFKIRKSNFYDDFILYKIFKNLIFFVYEKTHTKFNLDTTKNTNFILMEFQNYHKNILALDLFKRLQLAAVTLNISVIATTLYKIVGFDIAFGWQTSLNITPELFEKFIKLVSIPWTWIPQAIPDLNQISGSRLILKDGIVNLVNQDLTSWWPFLIAATITYGLCPRILLWLFSEFALRKKIQSVNLEQSRFQAPFNRIQIKLQQNMTTTGDNSPDFDNSWSDSNFKLAPKTKSDAVIFVPDEIKTLLDQAGITITSDWFSCSEIKDIHHMNYDSDLMKSKIKGSLQQSPHISLIFLVEGWQPPIREIARLFQDLTQVISIENIQIQLMGQIKNSKISPVSELDLKIWRQFFKKQKIPLYITGLNIP